MSHPRTSSVGVVDFGLSNLTSICRGLEEAGAGRVAILAEPHGLEEFSHVVLPGVGAFDAAMDNLNNSGWPEALRGHTEVAGKPLLGVCLGLQLLADGSDEGRPVKGLGLISGRVVRLPSGSSERVPHVGWNTVTPQGESKLLSGFGEPVDFYFVHSFVVQPTLDSSVAATTPFGGGSFASGVASGAAFGVQFHPEKSSGAGLKLLSNFVSM